MRCSCLTHICSLQDSQLSVTHNAEAALLIEWDSHQLHCRASGPESSRIRPEKA